MKTTSAGYLFIFFLLFISCTKITQQGEALNQNNSINAIQVVTNAAAPNGVLCFKTKEDFDRIAQSVKNDELDLSTILPPNFKSLSNLLSDFKKTGKIDVQHTFVRHFHLEQSNQFTSNSSTPSSVRANQDIENGSMEDFVTSSYESLVPDDVFQQFLNADLQIMVGSALYQITPLGTFEVQLYNIDYFSSWTAINSINIWTNPGFVIPGESSIGGGLYQVSDGIVRQDIDDPYILGIQNTVYPTLILDPPTAGPEPSGPSIPMTLAIADGRGEGTGVVDMPDNRRFRFRSCNNYYIIWSSVGIEGKVQRFRRFLWMSYWGQSFADEIIVGIDNLDLKTNYVIPTPETMAAMQMAFPKFKGLKKFKLGNHVADYMAFALGGGGLYLPPWNFSEEKVSKFFSGQINSFLANQVTDLMKDFVPAMIDQYVDPTYKDRYKNEPIYFSSYKQITDQTQLRFTAAQVYRKQGYSDENNWRFDWNIMLSLNGETAYKYEMKTCNFIGKARIGNNWAGVRVVKY